MLALTIFAVKNRICGDRSERRNREKIESFFKSYPDAKVYPGHHGDFDEYADCIYKEPVSLCDATGEELKSIRVLLAQDARLDALMSFDALLAERSRECLGAPLAAPPAPKPRDLDPRRCERDWDWYEPPLIPLARILRLPAFDAAGHHCRSNAGYFFLEEHCGKTLTARLRQRAGRDHWMPPELGIERYLCPLLERDFNQRT